MRFSHISDCHIGGWRDQKMSILGVQAFQLALAQSIEKKVDFLLIGGDLFNTALPPIDKLKDVVIALKKLKDNDIPCYVIPGSHDFSPSGKTMLDVLEHAGLMVNVCKGSVENNELTLRFTTDKKTGAKITGMIGKKGMLDRKFYEKLNRTHLEQEQGFKIFMFHTALSELKPKELEKMESQPVSLLPKDFNYYAGGHVHIIEHRDFDEHKNIVYPGALFPNNFREIETFKRGGYYLYDDGIITFNPIVTKEVECIHINCDFKTPAQVEKELLEQVKIIDAKDKIITMRIKGTLMSGKPSDIHMNEIFGMLQVKGAYYIMKSTSLVRTREFEKIKTEAHSVEDAEELVIKESLGQSDFEHEEELIKNLMKVFSLEKHEGETKYNFEKRVIEEADKTIR